MNLIIVFALGCIGSLAPEIVRLYSIRENPERFKWSWYYLVISAIFALLGGLVAVVLPATTYWGALYVGISTPILINTTIKKGLEAQQPHLKSAVRNEGEPSLLRSFLGGL